MEDQAEVSYSPDNPRFPNIEVQLVGLDGNAFVLMGAVTRAMRRDREARPLVDEFTEEATSGDYNNLLRTCASWVSVS